MRNSDEGSFSLIKLADKLSKIAVITSIAAALLFGLFMLYMSHAEMTPEKYMDNGNRFISSNDFDQAIKEYELCLSRFPEYKDVYWALISANLEKGNMPAASEYANLLLDSGLLFYQDYASLIDVCERIGDLLLKISVYEKWLSLNSQDPQIMATLAEMYAHNNQTDRILPIVDNIQASHGDDLAALVLRRLISLAQGAQPNSGDSGNAGGAVASGSNTTLGSGTTSGNGTTLGSGKGSHDYAYIISLCEKLVEIENASTSSLTMLAKAYSAAGRTWVAAATYERVLGIDIKNAEAFDGLLSIYYSNDNLKERVALLETAVRNIGSQKYNDMLETSRQKLAEYYSRAVMDGVVYRDGIFKVDALNPEGLPINPETSSFNPYGVEYIIEYYDNYGNEKQIRLNNSTVIGVLSDVDHNGVREIITRRYIAEGLDISSEATQCIYWDEIYSLDREIGRLIYSTSEYPAYFKNVYAAANRRKISQFERLEEAMEGHYGVTYCFLVALEQAALQFANSEWEPDSRGEALAEKLCEIFMASDFEAFIDFKNTMYGKMDNDIIAENGVLPGLADEEVLNMFGPPLNRVTQPFRGIAPDGSVKEYLTEILEYPDLNIYTSDKTVKAIRINSRDIAGPRGLRIGDGIMDIVNKFPSSYFDETANFPARMRDADIELKTDTGVVLSYSMKSGVIIDIEIFLQDDTGDYRPGTNVITPSAPPAPFSGDQSTLLPPPPNDAPTDADGGDVAGGNTADGDTAGGDATGGNTTGGDATGGDATGGDAIDGDTAGGNTLGGDATDGDATNGNAAGASGVGGSSSSGEMGSSNNGGSGVSVNPGNGILNPSEYYDALLGTINNNASFIAESEDEHR